MQLAAELQRVLAESVGNMIDNLEPLIRTLDLGPFEPAQRLKEAAEPLNFESGQSTIERVCYTVVYAQTCGRLAVIRRECRLVQPIVSKAKLVNPVGVGDVCPAYSQ